jgi:hypothetical protein
MDHKRNILMVLCWIGFFVAEVTVKNELIMTAFAACMSAGLLIGFEKGEALLYAIGLALGLVIEVGLGLIFRMQHWDNASLFGVPYWLPIIWGFGFVTIRRIGNYIVALSRG